MTKSFTQKMVEYCAYLFHVHSGKVIDFPTGYCCGHCEIAFSNYQARNYHEWLKHPGCIKYRKKSFWNWMFDGDDGKIHGAYHSCVCSKNDIGTCDECKRSIGVYR